VFPAFPDPSPNGWGSRRRRARSSRHAANQVGEPLFLGLLRWRRDVVGLAGFALNGHGAYPDALAELPTNCPE
jgi:hypothetical protein